MVKKEKVSSNRFELLSEKQKKAMGWDFSSFIKRMENRLKKIRGEASEEGFWSKYNYQKTHQIN